MGSREVPDPRNVLLAAPPMDDCRTRECYDHLGGFPPEETDLLRVTYHGTPQQLTKEWAQQIGPRPANTVVVSVNDNLTTDTSGTSVPTDEHIEVLTANPNDLTGLGIVLSKALTELEKTDNDLVVCFDSISTLLHFSDVESVYKFLHVFTGRLREFGAHAHFHINPDAHDTQTISRLKTVFDDLVDVTE